MTPAASSDALHGAVCAFTPPMTADEVKAYVGSPGFAAATLAPDFESRCVALFERLEAGEGMTLAAAANWLRMPWPVAGVLLAAFAPSFLPPLPGKAALQ